MLSSMVASVLGRKLENEWIIYIPQFVVHGLSMHIYVYASFVMICCIACAVINTPGNKPVLFAVHTYDKLDRSQAPYDVRKMEV